MSNEMTAANDTEQSDDNSANSNESVFVELIGVTPDEIPHDEESSEHTELANEIYQLIEEEYGFNTEGVSVCVNDDYHVAINEACGYINTDESSQGILPQETETVHLSTLDIGRHLKHPETGERVRLIDVTSLDEHMNCIWICERVRDGQYAGTITDGSAATAEPVEVEAYPPTGPGVVVSGETFERTVTVTEPAWIEQEHSVNGNGDVVAVSPKKADVGIDELMPQATYVTDEGDELRNWDEARNYLETGELPR
jgi:hypothetical protein